MPTKQITRQNLSEYATVALTIEPETISVDEQIDDAETKEWIRAELENGNDWAWCTAIVTASYDGLVGYDSLGGCSYRSRDEFEVQYFASMTEEALDSLWSQMEHRTPSGRAKAMALSARQAITTSYRGPTDHKGSRVIARCEAKRISVPWDHALDLSANHAAAAIQLMNQLGWAERNDLVMGGTGDGYVFVQIPRKGE